MFKNNSFQKSERANCCLIRSLCSIYDHRLSNSFLHTYRNSPLFTTSLSPLQPRLDGFQGDIQTHKRIKTHPYSLTISPLKINTPSERERYSGHTRQTKTWRTGEEEHLNFNAFICILQTFGKQMKETATMEQCFFPRETHPRSNSLMYSASLQKENKGKRKSDKKRNLGQKVSGVICQLNKELRAVNGSMETGNIYEKKYRNLVQLHYRSKVWGTL